MVVDCPCGEMYDSRDFERCPHCTKAVSIRDTDERHDHYPEPSEGEEDGNEYDPEVGR